MAKEIKLQLPANLDSELLAQLQELLQSKSTDNNVEKLKKLAERLSIQHTFKKGDIVRWKEGLQNKKMPLSTQFAIVIDILEKPIYDNQAEAGSPYFMDKLDIVLGFVDENRFLTFHYNSSRFEPIEE